MAIQPEHWISLEEYHEIEESSDAKYEYSNGRIYEVSGVTAEHNRITINMITSLWLHLRGKGYCVLGSDMKVLPLGHENPSYHPRITVIGNPEDYDGDSTAIWSPRLIVEVLSPSTFVRERGEKLRVYRMCPTMEEYVMVSSHHQEVEIYRRESARVWTSIQYTAEQEVTLASVGFTISMAEIYAQTDIPPMGLPESVLYAY